MIASCRTVSFTAQTVCSKQSLSRILSTSRRAIGAYNCSWLKSSSSLSFKLRTANRTQSVLPRTITTSAASAEMVAKEAPVGRWVSPITSELITSQSIGLGAPTISPDGRVFWLEGRPTEGGRQVMVSRSPEGVIADVLPGVESGFNARTRVHEYGGGESIIAEGVVYWSNFKDQQLYKQVISPEGATAPERITDPEAKQRFSDGSIDVARGRLITIVEDHSGEGEAVNSVAAVDLATGKVEILAGGRDFYAAPRLSADGSRMAWVCWDHPSMPWDDTELWVADVAADGKLENKRKVAGGAGESVTQPLWAGSVLHFISDRTDFWNIYSEAAPGQVKALVNKDAEFAGPAWVFGSRSYQVLPGGNFLVVFNDPKEAGATLAVVSASGEISPLKMSYYTFGNLSVRAVGGKLLVATSGGSPLKPSEIVLLEVDSVDALKASTPDQWQVLQRSSKALVDEKFLSAPESIEFPTEGGLTSYMYYYPPRNGDFSMPPGEKPPLLVKIHGGPTAAASAAFSLGIQYWTSRGYAVADINYGGSAGYGRKYRKRLAGSWGIVDVDDCSNAAKYLAGAGRVDPKRLCITGGSAGGYTTLACLAFRDVFSAGASHYGVADLELLAKETHKFESRYLDGLVGPWPAAAAIYKERSPIESLEKFEKPVAFFQGDEDQVVPPNQAVIMHKALAEQGLATALVMFKGEQHGFRAAANIRAALDGELYFYGKVLGFHSEMPDGLEAMTIDNLPAQK